MLDIMISTKLLYCMTPFSDYEKKRAAAEAFNNPMQKSEVQSRWACEANEEDKKKRTTVKACNSPMQMSHLG